MCNTSSFYITVGQQVPNFEIEIYDSGKQDFGKLSLADIKAKKEWLILFFYPADFTFVCPTELDDLAKIYDELKKMGCEVLSVSTDTKFTHLAWHRDELLLKGVKYPMGADTTGNLSRMFGVYDENTGLALRGTFIINPEGKLVASEINYYNVGRNAEELLRKMKANIYLAVHPDEACPARWQEGEKTLKPSAELVGNVYKALS